MPNRRTDRPTVRGAQRPTNRLLNAGDLSKSPKTYSWIQNTRDSVELNQRIRQGLEFDCVIEFQAESRLPSPAIARVLGLTPENFRLRRRDGRLTPLESDRLVRLSSLFERVVIAFHGSKSAAKRWLTNACAAFRQQTPLEFAETEFGASEVERVIGRMEHGVFT